MSNRVPETLHRPDAGFRALCGIAAFYRIAADPTALQRELALQGRDSDVTDILRAARLIGMNAKNVRRKGANRLARLPMPAIVRGTEGRFRILAGVRPDRTFRLIDPIDSIERHLSAGALVEQIEPDVILLSRRKTGPGTDPGTLGLSWFWGTIWRYRRPLGIVFIAAFFIQCFSVVTPLFFQVVIDKVLAHKSFSTLYVMAGGIALIGIFDVLLQFLRSYILYHTANRIDVELGQKLIAHLLSLPLSFFEIRSAGQTVARVRELETIRGFLTGQALFTVLDVAFTFIFFAILYIYSPLMTAIVAGSIPVYAAIALVMRPILQRKIEDRFQHGAMCQQFLVESIIGVHTLKAAAVEPLVRSDWGEKLSAYARSSFGAAVTASVGQNAIQYCSRAVTALLLFIGSKLVIEGSMSVGELIAFNMISAQVAQPIIRLSQFAQDLQRVKISVDRISDILLARPEKQVPHYASARRPAGRIEFRGVTFRYRPGTADVLKAVDLTIMPGDVIGIVGASGSGKSTLTKLVQRLYQPQEGQVLIDGADLNNVDPTWLRSNIGVVLQENLLFNRSIRDNIALAAPGLPPDAVLEISKLAGADEFIGRMPEGYETMIEERGANLSGGQRQRIAIARALATNPPILILDEATSALDYESERIIQQNMREIVANRTVIIIAHRLAAVRGCNRIIAMDNGRIVEDGPPKELLKRDGGLFRKLWEIQSEGVTA